MPSSSKPFWELLLRDDDISKVLMRFVWNVPLGLKRKFVKAPSTSTSRTATRCSRGCPTGRRRASSRRTSAPEERSVDFELVNQGYLGYMNLGLQRARGRPDRLARSAARQAVRGKVPAKSACMWPARPIPRAAARSRSISRKVLELMGNNGKFREAMELIENCNPLPNVTGASARRNCNARASART